MPSYLQLSAIKKAFPHTKVIKKGWNYFEIELNIQPCILSELYQIKITYTKNTFVKVYVINKILKLAPNRTKLPHVYNSKRQQLCLYSPSKKEWNSTKYIVKTIIPWASEWLYYYELWLSNGQWYGGGHNEYPSENSNNILKNE